MAGRARRWAGTSRARVVVGLAAAALLAGAAPAAAAIDFRADWEDARTGEAPPAPWEGLEYGGTFDHTPAPREQLAIVDAPVRSGSRAARFTVRPGDRYGGSTGERALVRWLGSNEQDGDVHVYGWSTLFPEDWRQPPGWGLITEWHADARFPLAPVRLNAAADSLTLALSSGECPTPYGCEVQRNVPLLPTLSRGRWNDLVVRISWRTGPTGRIQVWHRVEGEAGFRAVLDLRDVPTLPWRAGEAPPLIYLLHGLYRDAGPGTSTVYHDGFVRGDSVAEVMATFPAGGPAGSTVERVVDATCDACAVETVARPGGLHVTARAEGPGDDVDTAYAVLPVATAARGLVVRAAVSLLAEPSSAGSSTLLALLDGAGRPIGAVGVDRAGFLELSAPALELGGRAHHERTGAMLGVAGRQRQLELFLDGRGELVLVVDGVVRGRLGPDGSRPAAAVARVAAGLLRHEGPDGTSAPVVSLAQLRVEPDLAGAPDPAPDALPDPFDAERAVVTCPGCSVGAEGSVLVARAPVGRGPAYAVARASTRDWAWPFVVRAELRLEALAPTEAVPLVAVLDEDGHDVAEIVVSPEGRIGLQAPAGGLAGTPLLVWSGARTTLDGTAAVSVELELSPGGWVSLQLDGRESLVVDGLVGGTRARPGAIEAGIVGRASARGSVEVRVDRLVAEATS